MAQTLVLDAGPLGLICGPRRIAVVRACQDWLQQRIAVCSHLALRLVLLRARVLPWKLARFLDYGVERISLRRVGSGYIFVYRTVMEYFAQIDVTPSPAPGRGE